MSLNSNQIANLLYTQTIGPISLQQIQQLKDELKKLKQSLEAASDSIKSVSDAIDVLTGASKKVKKTYAELYENTFGAIKNISSITSRVAGKDNPFSKVINEVSSWSDDFNSLFDNLTKSGNTSLAKLGNGMKVAMPYLSSAAIGGMTGYTLGKQNALLGIGGGMASGAINGAMLAGPWGAAIGAAAGAAGGLFGWLFGGKKRLNYETAKISSSQATTGRYSGGNIYNISQFQSQVKDDFYLGDFLSTENAIQKKLQEVNLQINQIADDLDPANYKKLSKEAQEARAAALKNLQAQQSELEGLLTTSKAGYNSRKAHLEETEAAMRSEVASYSATLNSDPFTFNQPLWELQRNEAFQKYLHDREVYKDSPAIVSLLQQRMLLEDQQLLKSRSLQKITAKQNETDFLYKVESARLSISKCLLHLSS